MHREVFFFLFVLFSSFQEKLHKNFEEEWVQGSSSRYSDGYYDEYNSLSFPASRMGSSIWSDSDNIVIFGGVGNFYLNDMHISTDGIRFYWIGGSADDADESLKLGYYSAYGEFGYPKSRSYSAYWVLHSKLFLFGGKHPNTNFLNDLFETSFSILNKTSIEHTSLWKWQAGSDFPNMQGIYIAYDTEGYPAARYSPFFWVLNNTAYLYGGERSYGLLDDIFTFNGSSFTWVEGTDFLNSFGYYLCYNCTGRPSSRSCGKSIDNETGLNLRMNDIWTLSVDGKKWIWLGGSMKGGVDALGRYEGIAPYPMAREDSKVVVIDNVAYLFGGLFSSNNQSKRFILNDWWSFTPEDQFTLLKGSNETSNPTILKGYYYQIGSSGKIGARLSHHMIYFLGYLDVLFGYGYDNNALLGAMNDIWRIMPPESQEESELSNITISFLVIISFFSLLTLVFIFYKKTLLFSPLAHHEKYYLIFTFIGILNFISDIINIFLLVFRTIVLFSISLSVFVLALVFNHFRTKKWLIMLLKQDNVTEIQRYLSKNQSIFDMIVNMSIVIHPSILFILKSNLYCAYSYQLPINSNAVSIPVQCVHYDIYSLLPQSILLYYFAFQTPLNWNILLWIVILIKCLNLIIAIGRATTVIFYGGGNSSIIKRESLKYGIQRTIKASPIPGLHTETETVVEIPPFLRPSLLDWASSSRSSGSSITS